MVFSSPYFFHHPKNKPDTYGHSDFPFSSPWETILLASMPFPIWTFYVNKKYFIPPYVKS